MTSRRRFKQTSSLQDRLSSWVRSLRAEADKLPPSEEKDELLKKIRQADAAAYMESWANSRGLQPPK
jgi:hypothetical protein